MEREDKHRYLMVATFIFNRKCTYSVGEIHGGMLTQFATLRLARWVGYLEFGIFEDNGGGIGGMCLWLVWVYGFMDGSLGIFWLWQNVSGKM